MDWHKCLEEVREIRKAYMCPFTLFAQKHGYDLKYDRLVFPNEFPEIKRMHLAYSGAYYEPWHIRYSREYDLPEHVTIGEVSAFIAGRIVRYPDKVLLVKFCDHERDGERLDWELIKKPWPDGSFCRIRYSHQIIRGPTIIS